MAAIPRSRQPNENEGPSPPEGRDDAQLQLDMEAKELVAEAASGNGGEPPILPGGAPGSRGPFRRRIDTNFLQYASYVIRDRAIPHLADGLKPVQRRILWSLHRNDDGKFIKVANIVGFCMQYHPHGDASIGDALVVLTNKRYLIEGQGNFGNIFTGDPAAAARYIECRLTDLARNELFNDELTELVPTYDGRKQEPVTLPAKLPLLLMLGAEGIAVGLSARILPHNFLELLQAQISILKKEPFKVLPDFPTGGLMDASEYADGNGSVRLRARIQVNKDSSLIIREIPPTTTCDSLIESIEEAVRKGKIKVRSINDFTSEKVEIEIKLPPGVDAEQMIPALYAFTDCEANLTSRIVVIDNNRPVELTVSEVLQRNTAKLLKDLRAELELTERKLQEELHFKTIEQIFVENRLYKKIESCRTGEAVSQAVYDGFVPFKQQLLRPLNDQDVTNLLQVRIRRISLFDINKHKEEMQKVKQDLLQVQKQLKSVTKYAIGRLQALIKQYGEQFRRLTKVQKFDTVAAREVAFKTFKVTYDRERGYVGHKVSGGEFPVQCSDYDKIVLVWKDGRFKVIPQPEKLFVGPDLVYLGAASRDQAMVLAYTTRDATYLKRFTFGGTIMNKEYRCLPPKSKIIFFEPSTPELLYIKYKPAPYQKINQQIAKPAELTIKGAKSRGNQISIKEVSVIGTQPPRGWKPDETITPLKFAS